MDRRLLRLIAVVAEGRVVERARRRADDELLARRGVARWARARRGCRPVTAQHRILGYFSGALPDSNEICCVLNHQRRLTLPHPTAAPTATQLRVCLTLHYLWRQAEVPRRAGARAGRDDADAVLAREHGRLDALLHAQGLRRRGQRDGARAVRRAAAVRVRGVLVIV